MVKLIKASGNLYRYYDDVIRTFRSIRTKIHFLKKKDKVEELIKDLTELLHSNWMFENHVVSQPIGGCRAQIRVFSGVPGYWKAAVGAVGAVAWIGAKATGARAVWHRPRKDSNPCDSP